MFSWLKTKQPMVQPTIGQRVERLPFELRLVARAPDVDERRLAGDGEGFLDRADGHVGVHVRDELAAQLDALAPHRGKAGQREGDGVGTGAQVDDAIQPLAVPEVSLTTPVMLLWAHAAAGSRNIATATKRAIRWKCISVLSIENG
jgi:hypothetical protein